VKEDVEYLKGYLDMRKRGTPSGKIPPEQIDDESPLIRDAITKRIKHICEDQIYRIVHNVYLRTGLIKDGNGKRYDVRPHSLRKYFRTQLTALGTPTDYTEYMMGHKISTYNDIQMKGVEFLRKIYTASGLSIRPKTKIGRAEVLKDIMRSFGYDPERILVKDSLVEPHRTVVGGKDEDVQVLGNALKELLKKELLSIKEEFKLVPRIR